VALALLLSALATAYLLILAPILDLYNERQAVIADREMLAPRLDAAASELPALRARLAELQTAAKTRKIMLDGASDSIASANLQSRIEELAAAAGVSIGSTEALAADNTGGYRRIGLRVAIGGEYEAFIRLLGTIETAAPPLILSNLQIHSSARPAGINGGRRAARTDNAAQTGIEPPNQRIDAGFEVYGFRSVESPVAPKQ
jgi:general secretion pathway protein M